ncbi:MAG TPA: GFA family protein [Rhodopila sp.]
MPEITGSCRCGKVTYASTAEPVFAGICHCETCQKSTGSAFATVVAVPAASLTVSGPVTRFDAVGDSGSATHREFCPVCGSTVTQSADVMPGLTMVTVGTLDDPDWVQPAVQIFCDSAMPWAKIDGPQIFARMPG